MKPFTFLLFSAIVSPLVLSACSPSTASAPNINRGPNIQQTQNLSIIDLNKGQGSMRVTLRAQTPQAFGIQANTDGQTAKTSTDVSNLEVFLFDIDSGVSPTAGTAVAPLDLDGATGITLVSSSILSFTGANQTVLLKNIPANVNASGRFFIGVRALESTQNITDPITGFSYGTGSLAISSSGGDTAQPGGVSIDASYTVSNATALGVNVPLLSALGATLDAQVSVSDGSTTLSGIDIQ